VEFRANMELLRWAQETGAEHFTLLSAICVQKPRLAFQHAKLRFEQALTQSGLSHSIVRPTAFFKSLSGQLERVRAGKPFLVFADGELTSCKPIAESDLASYLRLSIEDPKLRGVLPIGGPGPAITPLMQVEMLARLLGRDVGVRRVPPSMLLWISRALDVPGALSSRFADRAEFARIGHYYATESMLLWNAEAERYDAPATPEFGTITLEDSYRAQLEGSEQQHLGEHGMF
jgi:divinyl chlorophyllide a 8-vinyl-reductase